ncbi:MAG TPA: LacI family DNA-binding transcriptional regulator [Intrasporangium sp.]|uniref:LacI family DNA-binding transcriptional regulator n=1 Tax=Intrasporangium sp. TaxID=1925024 RepID=UPI002D76F7F6|nr:LacI family DNA-binding transcriptional regulator [Intrasporangium sp.]HET7398730.1 LacI family DNA-binding transcriptional regulator [Intrasporangium sp.]
MGVTVKDVARAAGVSTATVSRALRGFATVDPETRAHILRTAERLDYVGSPAAAALSTGRTRSIGIITPYISRWSFARMLSGIERELRANELDVVLYCLGDPSDPHPAPPLHRLRRRVDGFIVMSVAAESPDLEELFKVEVPVSLIGTSAPGVASVLIDDTAGARTATEHLLSLGHRRIGLIYGRENRDPLVLERPRYLGFVAALEEAGIAPDPALEQAGHFTVEGGEEAMRRLLDADEPPTAVFAMSDEMAFGALRALRDLGREPGLDVALVGFDGHEMADVFGLSTVSQPLESLGSQGARNLVAELAQPGRPREVTVLPTELIVRSSSVGPDGATPRAARRRHGPQDAGR